MKPCRVSSSSHYNKYTKHIGNAKLLRDRAAEEFGSNEHVNLLPLTSPWHTHTLHRIRFKVETCKWIVRTRGNHMVRIIPLPGLVFLFWKLKDVIAIERWKLTLYN
jgi:hypothetical protein